MDNSVIMEELLNTLQSIDSTLKRIEQETTSDVYIDGTKVNYLVNARLTDSKTES